MTLAPPPPHEAVERLEELAKAATPGEWSFDKGSLGWVIFCPDGGVLASLEHTAQTYDQDDANAAYIAALSPAVFLSFAAHLRQVEEREAVMREALEPFAQLATAWEAGHHAAPQDVADDEKVPGRWVRMGELRRARTALTHSPETDDGRSLRLAPPPQPPERRMPVSDAPTVPEMKALGSSSPKSEDTHRAADGVVVVPREPTEAMARAVMERTWLGEVPCEVTWEDIAEVLRVMIDAATQQATGEGGYKKALERIARGDFNNGSTVTHRSARHYASWALRNIGGKA